MAIIYIELHIYIYIERERMGERERGRERKSQEDGHALAKPLNAQPHTSSGALSPNKA